MKKLLFILIVSLSCFLFGCSSREIRKTETVTITKYEIPDKSDTSANKAVWDETDNIYSELEEYLSSVREQSDTIKYSLANDPLTQTDLNLKSMELYELWDSALNYLWEILKNTLSEEEFEELLVDQRAWITAKESASEEAGKEMEGGSMYALVVNSIAASMTEERVSVLYEQLK